MSLDAGNQITVNSFYSIGEDRCIFNQYFQVIIKERRLKASVHNGLNFTDQFQVVYLENVHNSVRPLSAKYF